uniref:Uncharacterized protein n=1 Tax=Anguilla anguilla TaxID=7936 RepID=A0A0E9U1D7_ANGAN
MPIILNEILDVRCPHTFSHVVNSMCVCVCVCSSYFAWIISGL